MNNECVRLCGCNISNKQWILYCDAYNILIHSVARYRCRCCCSHLEENQFMVLHGACFTCSAKSVWLLFIFMVKIFHYIICMQLLRQFVSCSVVQNIIIFCYVVLCVMCCCSLLLLLISFSAHSLLEGKEKKRLLSAFWWSKNALLLILFAPHLHKNEEQLFLNSFAHHFFHSDCNPSHFMRITKMKMAIRRIYFLPCTCTYTYTQVDEKKKKENDFI